MKNSNQEKMSQLVFDMRIARKLLKMNTEWKYCPFCGSPLNENCECHKNIIIDIKKKHDTENETIAVFYNNEKFKEDYSKTFSDMKKKDTNTDQIMFDFDG